jgi:hypothetical protein
MNTWFTRALLIWSTSTSYDNKRDFKVLQIEYCRQNLSRVDFLNGDGFGPSMAHDI